MKVNKHKINWMIDIVLFAGFILAFMLDWTSLALHQWLGVGVGVLAIYHLLEHWDWAAAVTRRFILGASGRARLYYLIDALLAFGLLLILESGLLISTWLALPVESYSAWVDFHVGVSILTLLLVVVKIGLHWRWVVRVAQRYIFRPAAPALVALPARPANSTANSRREFLKLMGIVGAATTVALFSALESEEPADAIANVTTASAYGSGAASTGAASAGAMKGSPAQTVPSGACTVRCQRGCSYPGHCRRYVDANLNGLCDLGECL